MFEYWSNLPALYCCSYLCIITTSGLKSKLRLCCTSTVSIFLLCTANSFHCAFFFPSHCFLTHGETCLEEISSTILSSTEEKQFYHKIPHAYLWTKQMILSPRWLPNSLKKIYCYLMISSFSFLTSLTFLFSFGLQDQILWIHRSKFTENQSETKVTATDSKCTSFSSHILFP